MFLGNSNKISMVGNKNIVKNGLILHLDAANSNSYPGTGTTWYDLSGNGRNASLSGASYSSAHHGSIYLDGADLIYLYGTDWNSLGSTRSFTFMFGAEKLYYGTGGNNTGDSMLFFGADNGYNQGWRIVEGNGGSPGSAFTGNHSFYFGSPSISMNVGVTDTVNRPAICAFTQNGSSAYAFLNGNTATNNSFGNYVNRYNRGTVSVNVNVGVGRFLGYVSFILAYNRPITPSEIEQNYRAMNWRYS